MNAIDIIARAMRRIGALAEGQVPEGAALDDALETLKSILQRSISEGALGELKETIATAGDFTACEDSRVLRNNTDTTSISLPETVMDAATGNTRPPRDKGVITVSDQFSNKTTTYIYDGDIHRWLAIETLTATSVVPFSSRDAGGLAAYLAVELADEYGLDIREATVLAAQRFHTSLINDFSRDRPVAQRRTNYF